MQRYTPGVLPKQNASQISEPVEAVPPREAPHGERPPHGEGPHPPQNQGMKPEQLLKLLNMTGNGGNGGGMDPATLIKLMSEMNK